MDQPEKVGMSSERLERIGPVIERHLGEGKIAGAITLLSRRGKLVHLQCHGLMDRELSKPMRPDAIFRLFSMTKPITTVALMTLFELGLVRLAQPASDFLPAFGNLKVYEGESKGRLSLADLTRPITVRDLLAHTSGLTLPFWEYGPVEEMYRDAEVALPTPLGEFVDKILALPLAFQPGAKWRYSVGHDVIARIVELVSGKTYGDYLKQNIFDPLGMDDTGFYVPEGKLDRYCAEYGFADFSDPDVTFSIWLGDEGRLTPHLLRAADEGLEAKPHQIYRGGTGLVSTAPDCLRFCQMLLNGGEYEGVRILGRKTVELMTANHLTDAQLPADLLGPGWGWGLGVRVLMDLGSAQQLGSVGEHGWGGAAGAEYWIDPREQLIGIHMKQFQPGSYFPDYANFRTAAYQAIVD